MANASNSQPSNSSEGPRHSRDSHSELDELDPNCSTGVDDNEDKLSTSAAQSTTSHDLADDSSRWLRSGIDLRSLYLAQADAEGEQEHLHNCATVKAASTAGKTQPWNSLTSTIGESQQYPQRASSSTEQPSDFQLSLERSAQTQRYRKLQGRHSRYRVSPLVTLDYELVAQWSRICDQSHKPCRENTGSPLKLNILIIDCLEMNITTIGTNQKYFALSYVWGGAQALQLISTNFDELCTPKSLESRQRELSQTVWDAIKFVQRIGQRYLWVDRLCIIQDNQEVKHNGIKHMDVIYKNAWAVIIAGAGKDTTSGLPGVHKRPGVETPTRTEGQDEISEESLADTVYESRAWTYQERLLARRRFVFLNGFLLFQCLESTFRDDVYSGKGREPFDVRRMYLHEAGMAIEHFTDVYMAYQNVVHSYTTRDMRFDSDILNALAGIANVLGQRMGTKLVFGLPENNLIEALGWYIRGTPKDIGGRRIGFPSWSWCGWKGAVGVPPLRAASSRSTGSSIFDALPVIDGEKRLQLGTILFRMYVGEPCDLGPTSSAIVAYHKICDRSRDGKQCGRIQIHIEEDPTEKTQTRGKNEAAHFIVLQDAGRPSIPYKEREVIAARDFNRDRDQEAFSLTTAEKELYDSSPFLIVLMVVKKELDDGTSGWERAGVGHIYRRAIFLSEAFSFEDSFILC